MIYRRFAFAALVVCTLGTLTLAQTPVVPWPPFTARDAERGSEIAKKQLDLREQNKDLLGGAEPFKIAGNLYYVGVRNGDTLLLTSPQGHILIGAGFPNTTGVVERNIEKLGFKVADLKAILVNHHHINQAGGAAYFRQKTGAQVMVGFADVTTVERIGSVPAGRGGNNAAAGRGGNDAPAGRAGRGGNNPGAAPTAPAQPSPYGIQPPVKVDRALFDGDVIRVGPLAVTAYANPLHSLGSTTFAFTVREGGRDLKVAQYCCWELSDRNPNISDAVFERVREMHRKLAPLDIYLESGTYGWGGMVNQPSGTWEERFATLRANTKLFINPDIFTAVAAAREVEFQEIMAKVKAANPSFP